LVIRKSGRGKTWGKLTKVRVNSKSEWGGGDHNCKKRRALLPGEKRPM